MPRWFPPRSKINPAGISPVENYVNGDPQSKVQYPWSLSNSITSVFLIAPQWEIPVENFKIHRFNWSGCERGCSHMFLTHIQKPPEGRQHHVVLQTRHLKIHGRIGIVRRRAFWGQIPTCDLRSCQPLQFVNLLCTFGVPSYSRYCVLWLYCISLYYLTKSYQSFCCKRIRFHPWISQHWSVVGNCNKCQSNRTLLINNNILYVSIKSLRNNRKICTRALPLRVNPWNHLKSMESIEIREISRNMWNQ